MEGLHKSVLKIADGMEVLGGCVLTFMMLMTVTDVILRFAGRPITGTYELVFLSGALVIACAIPRASLAGAHVQVDFLVLALPGRARSALLALTRLMGIAFFLFLGWNLLGLGATLRAKQEVSLTLHVPIYPVVYALGGCAFVQCLVLFSTLLPARAEQGRAAEPTAAAEVGS
jgi:TRAP-type C4-dicarboxylate transport system permease small subunit